MSFKSNEYPQRNIIIIIARCYTVYGECLFLFPTYSASVFGIDGFGGFDNSMNTLRCYVLNCYSLRCIM